ncbi:MAG: hypothetical protein K2Y32_10465 [Candidatus Obscuribacterales bacterium]|nr:hypothetical protein [Candidatus Obscuribacterales bacterium]
MNYKTKAASLLSGRFSFLLILIMSLGCALFTTVARAENSAPTYLPSFQYGTNTYVDDRLAGSMRFDSAFAAQVRSLEAQHNLKFYVVVTERGNDLTGERRTWAASLLRNKLWDQWLNAADFKQAAQRSAILLMVRDYADPSHYSVALRVGDDLHKLGLNRDLFSAPNGPIVPALKTYLPVMPEQCLLAVLGNVNDLVQRGKQLQAQKDSQTNRGTDEPTAVKSEPAISDNNNSNEGIQPMTIALLIAAAVGVFFLLRAVFRGPQSSSRSTPPARSSTPVVLRKTERGQSGPASPNATATDTGSKTDNTGAIIGTAVGAGVLGHMIGSQQAEAAERARRERESSSTSSTSGGDSTYIPPVIADTTTTTTTSDGGGSTGGSSCGSSGGSSCGSSGGSSCGGGGGGGCGGGS